MGPIPIQKIKAIFCIYVTTNKDTVINIHSKATFSTILKLKLYSFNQTLSLFSLIKTLALLYHRLSV